MATEVTLPALGESVTEGTVTLWLKEVGDTIEVDEPLLEISTDKVDTEIPSPVSGTLLEIRAQVDDTIEVGAVLAVIGEEGESTGGDAAAPAAQAEESATKPEPEAAVEAPAEPETAAAAETASSAEGTEVTLPALGESVTEGTVTAWLKEVGDEVDVDEPLLEISTDKVDTEIPSPVTGTLLEIRAEVDETVEVGAVLAIVGAAGAAPATTPAAEPAPAAEPQKVAEEPSEAEAAPEPETAPAAEPAQSQPAQSETAQPEQPAPAASTGSGEAYVTPIVRKLARQHGVDLSTVTGTGVGGRIRKQDIIDAAKAAEAAAPAPAASAAPAPSAPQAPLTPSPLRGKTEKLSRLRKTIANRMLESLQVSAQLTTVIEVDVTEIARLREAHKEAFLQREGVKLTYLPFFAKATIEALKVFPQVNSLLDMEAGTVTYPEGEHLGIAVDTERGLIVPVIPDAGDLNISGLARKINDVATRTREGKINPDELSGGTFTLTNTGSRGALFDTPIINQPQVAILGTGAVVKRAAVMTDDQGSDSIAVRSMVMLALTYDHRIIDGADAGRFLTAIKNRLEAAEFEGELG